MPERTIESEPYAWPYNGDLRPENTALIVIDSSAGAPVRVRFGEQVMIMITSVRI